jgi:hypothetical protein
MLMGSQGKGSHSNETSCYNSNFVGEGGSGVTSDSDSKLRGGQLTTAWRQQREFPSKIK